MAIPKHEIEKMNALLSQSATIASLARKFPDYDYWEIYWAVSDYSILGKKRKVSNRLKKLLTPLNSRARAKLVRETQALVDDIYRQYKANGKKLMGIDRVLRK